MGYYFLNFFKISYGRMREKMNEKRKISYGKLREKKEREKW